MFRYSLCAVVFALSLTPVSAQTLPRAAEILDALPATIPLGESQGVALVPSGRGANPQGVLLTRDGTAWGDSEFVTLRTGAKSSSYETPDYVVLFHTRRGLDRAVNADAAFDAEVTVYARIRGAFVKVALDRAVLRKSGSVRGADRKRASELKEALAERTAPKPVPEAKSTATAPDWDLLVAHPELLVGGFAALGAWLATTKKRTR